MAQVDAQHAATHICDMRAYALEAKALSPTRGTLPTWCACKPRASGVAWGRLTSGDSSRIGICTCGRRCGCCAFSSRSSRGFRRFDRDHGHAHKELYAAVAFHRDRTNRACCCGGHGCICANTERPLFVGKPPATGAVITSAQEPSQLLPLRVPPCVRVHACESAWVYIHTRVSSHAHQ